jgi:hypothetical protein
MVHAIEEGERIRVLSPMATQTIRKWTLVTNHVLSCTLEDRNKRHSSPFINVVKGVFFVVCVTLVPVSYLSSLYISIQGTRRVY